MSDLDRRVVGYRIEVPQDPPAGENLHHCPDLDTRIAIISVHFRLVTDGTAENRRAVVEGSDGTFAFSSSPAPANQAASLTRDYRFAQCVLGIDGDTDLLMQWACLASDLVLDPGSCINTEIINLQSGDQLSNFVIRYKQSLPF